MFWSDQVRPKNRIIFSFCILKLPQINITIIFSGCDQTFFLWCFLPVIIGPIFDTLPHRLLLWDLVLLWSGGLHSLSEWWHRYHCHRYISHTFFMRGKVISYCQSYLKICLMSHPLHLWVGLWKFPRINFGSENDVILGWCNFSLGTSMIRLQTQ